jgi:hypothetical protein
VRVAISSSRPPAGAAWRFDEPALVAALAHYLALIMIMEFRDRGLLTCGLLLA